MLVSLSRRGHSLSRTEEQLRVLDGVPSSFSDALAGSALFPLRPRTLDVLQINVGKVCNQTCVHCHVDAGPDRTESMSDAVFDRTLQVYEENPFQVLDVTGGAPELHPRFRELLRRGSALPGRRVIHRCNLTAILSRPYADLPELFAEQRVEVVASLPHYKALNTDRQRGEGIFDKSIRSLRQLNALGYGRPGSGLVLNLVTNPPGAVLPGSQPSLEREWRRELDRRYGIRFNELFVLTNMPISRFLDFLLSSENFEHYMTKLANAFNPVAASNVMCRDLISVSYDGKLYDCDFNQMLELGLTGAAPKTIFEFDRGALLARAIAVRSHCFGCTAGAGSSCGGQTI